ncbi:MAG: SGNH/GDSL hydrolase family protein [Deltaproteobacteria bacterium]|jgi:lysophospholipase L1-like esterase|nr:SGNH/GDSL hydrolase family protein [Deltaproteobacteria bacterium]
MKRPSLAKRVLFALPIAALVLAGIELAARRFAPVPKGAQFGQQSWVVGEILRLDDASTNWTGDPELLWRLKPHAQVNWGATSGYDGHMEHLTTRLNGYGWRGPEVAAKMAGERRALHLGDSCTWGIGTPERETYAARLGPLLEARASGRWSSVNAGVPSYSSFQGFRLFARYQDELAPDVVTIYFGWNDAWMMSPDAGNHIMSTGPGGRVLRALYRSTAFQRARLFVFDTLPERNTPRVAPDDFRANVLAMVERARGAGTPAILIVPPVGPDPRTMQPTREPANHAYVAVLRELGGEPGVTLVDAARDFEASEHPLYFHDPIHPNSAGHARIAELLADAIAGLPGIAR